MRKRKWAAVLLVVSALVFIFLNWRFSLSWNLHFGVTWLYIEVISLILVIAIRLWFSDKETRLATFTDYLAWIPGVILVGMVVVAIWKSPIFCASEYYGYVADLVTVVEGDAEQSAFPNLIGKNGETSNLPLYGVPEAIKKAETEMGKYPALGSQFELWEEDLTSQSINGNLCYVIPLQPKSMLKWDESEGNKGYFIIDRNSGEATFVENSLKYTTQAPFSSNVRRKLRQYDKRSGITDISPEVDDDGVFHYVATTYEQDAVGAMEKVTGILDMNAQTGEIKRYGLDEIPSYVDRVYPEDLFLDYIYYYGQYKKGYLNSWFGQKEVQEATEEYAFVYIDGECYYYTGWTSAGKHESSNGIIMMNSRTGEITLYQTYGISEEKACGVAEGKVQEKEYTAGYPLLLKVAGEETYYSIMRDRNENLVGYALVSYKDYTKVAVADTLKEAQNLYVKSLSTSATAEVFHEEAFCEAKGKIGELSSEVLEGTTIYYVRIEGSQQIYSFYSKLEPDIVFAKQGDEIVISYIPAEEEVIAAVGVKLQE